MQANKKTESLLRDLHIFKVMETFSKTVIIFYFSTDECSHF